MAPVPPAARFEAALARWRSGDPVAAATALAALVRDHPRFFPAQAELAGLMLARGDVAGAWSRLEPLLPHAASYPRIAYLAEAAEGRIAAERLARGDAAGAATLFRSQWQRNPASRTAPRNLAAALEALGQYAEAKSIYAEAVLRGEHDAGLLGALAHLKARECDWDGLDALLARLAERAPQPGTTAPPQLALYFDGIGAATQRRWAEAFCAQQWGGIAPLPVPPAREPGAPLRVGFLSNDFRVHPTARLVAGLVERHDRERVRFIAFSDAAPVDSPERRRLVAAFDDFIETGALDDAKAAERIRAERIDVLLDMGGHTAGARLGVAARRPARVQGHFLGYPGTCGAPFLDFFVGDAVAVPPGAEAHFTERVLRMPVTCQPNDPARARPEAPSRSSCGLPEEAVVFAAFHQPVKITPVAFARWCALLAAVPGSVLWLLEYEPLARANLQRHAAKLGLEPARLVFAPLVGPDQHIARARNADLAVDTFPCTSHTTASDLLWAGVPFVTVTGDTFASRMAASVLAAAGCSDWVFEEAAAADAALLALAHDARRRGEARDRLEAARTRSPLFDAEAFARGFEALLAEAERISRP